MGREYELKFRADDAALEAVRLAYGEFNRIDMETVYYDAPGRPLGSRFWTLRRRLENGEAVCTLKTSAQNGGRGEWEVLCGDIVRAVPLLVEKGAPAEVSELVSAGLEPVCGARFTRLAKTLEVPGGRVELALDKGVLLGGGNELPFAEIEAELKEGPDTAADAFAKDLAERFGLVPEKLSKFRRALLLSQQV